MNQTSSIQNKKFNIRMFPIYKALSWDLLFYYSISFLFLTQTKGISASEVLFSDAFYPIFKFLFQIPCTSIVNRIGKKSSLMIGNILVGLSVFILIFATGLPIVIFSQFLSAFGFALKGIVEDTFLYDSIPNSKKRNDLFSRISGKGAAWYYYVDAISATITGFLFVWNAYLPIIISTLFCLISAFISYRFVEISPKNKKLEENNKKTSELIKENLSDIKQGFEFIFNSRRLRSLILYYAVFKGMVAVLVSLRSSILSDLQVPDQYFGIIFAVFGIISGIASQNSNWFHNRFRNQTLKVFAYVSTFSMIAVGLCVISGFNTGLCLEIIFIAFILQYITKGPFQILIQRYLNSFSTPSLRVKISSASDLVYSIGRASFAFMASALLGIASTAYTFTILGCILTLFFIFLLDYMKDKVGLKPEQYSRKDIEFTELK